VDCAAAKASLMASETGMPTVGEVRRGRLSWLQWAITDTEVAYFMEDIVSLFPVLVFTLIALGMAAGLRRRLSGLDPPDLSPKI
jgi:hypothetical protein